MALGGCEDGFGFLGSTAKHSVNVGSLGGDDHVDGIHAAGGKGLGLLLGDAQGLGELMDGAAKLLLESFGSGAILLDVDFPAGEAGGETGILAALADGKCKILLVDGDADGRA